MAVGVGFNGCATGSGEKSEGNSLGGTTAREFMSSSGVLLIAQVRNCLPIPTKKWR